jgi:integrase
MTCAKKANVTTLTHHNPRSADSHTSYNKKQIVDFGLEVAMDEIYIRKPEWTQSWHQEVADLLRRRYEIAGWSRNLFMQDFSMLRVICGDKHPKDVFLQDLEEMVLKAKTQGTRETYVARIKSVWNSLRILGIIPSDYHVESGLPKVKMAKTTPRPLSKEQAVMLMTTAKEPMREWFMFACLAGMRAIEISRVRGDWLETHAGTHFLRIHGKGDTDLLIPCHPKLVELIQSKNVLGRLYTIEANYLSRIANAEMRRLGIATRKSGTGSKLSLHSCRHFFATEVLSATNNLITTQRLMRHASPVMTARYAGLVRGEESKAMQHLLEDIKWESEIAPPPPPHHWNLKGNEEFDD